MSDKRNKSSGLEIELAQAGGKLPENTSRTKADPFIIQEIAALDSRNQITVLGYHAVRPVVEPDGTIKYEWLAGARPEGYALLKEAVDAVNGLAETARQADQDKAYKPDPALIAQGYHIEQLKLNGLYLGYDEYVQTTNTTIVTEKTAKPKAGFTNKIESEEIFTASNNDKTTIIPKAAAATVDREGKRGVKTPPQATVQDKGNRLETNSNSESTAENLVRIAASRGWNEIKVSGTDTFRREVWLEAAGQGMTIRGYTPTEQDKVALAKKVSEASYGKIEKANQSAKLKEKTHFKETNPYRQMANDFRTDTPIQAVEKHPELAGAMAAVAVINKKTLADGLTPQQRAIVAARVKENIAAAIERGKIPEIKVRDELAVTQTTTKEQEYTR